jgi:hypothetical protein
VDYPTVARLAARDESTGVPTRLAFLDTTSDGLLWREPGDDYTAKLRYWLPFTIWTPGDDDDTQLNLPDDVLIPVLIEGAAAVLKGPSPESAYAREAWGRFEAYCLRMAGAGTLGARVVQSRPVAKPGWIDPRDWEDRYPLV